MKVPDDKAIIATILLSYFISFARGAFVPSCGRFRANKLWGRKTTNNGAEDNPASTGRASIPERVRAKIKLDHSGEEVAILSRTVVLTNEWNVTVYELEHPAPLVERYWDLKCRGVKDTFLDPFGLVAWPGAVVAAREAQRVFPNNQLENKTILILGAGPGVEAMAMAQLGAKHVIATDIHPTTLQLLRYGSKKSGLEHIIATQEFDLFSEEELPSTDLVVAADVMYDEKLGRGLGRRLAQLLKKDHPPKILISDSQRLTDFIPDLHAKFPELSEILAWEERLVDGFTGSGVLVDEDQTYNVTARVLLIGFGEDS